MKIHNKKTPSRKAVTQAFADQDSKKLNTEELQDVIRLKAYELYVQRGAQPGGDMQDWLMAERIVLGS